MASSSKKITYTNDFKLKVLDYYFKHGGDNSFGLKTKTAHHFNIDKKTINRMLKNPDMVKKARKLGAKKPILTSAKSSGKSIGKTTKNLHRPGFSSKGSSSSGGSSNTTGSKTGCGSSTSSGSMKHSSSTASSSSSGAKGGGGQGNKAALSSGKSGPSGPGRPKPGSDDDVEVQVFDLPEDPDYSVLKRSINTSTNGVAGISKLLITGTPEVQNMLLHECDIIMECKVCRNLFRSVANFLAHKRIYCRETYSDVRSLFHKGETEGITNQSGTVIVVPEPPLEEAEIAESTSSSVQSTNPSKINNLAVGLVGRQKPQQLSSSTGKGTSKYFEKILEVNKKRNLISQDCSVVLEDIAGVTNARFQSYNSKDPSSKSMKCIVDQIQQKSLGLTVVLNEHGQITKTAPGNAEIDDIKEEFEEEEESHPPTLVCSICNTSFATRKTLSRHQRSFHEMERTIFSCPMCKNKFFSMWATVKHLQRFHRKSATYIQRVRNTIKERSCVRPIPKKLNPKDQVQANDIEEEVEEEEEEEEVEEDVGKDRTKLELEENIGKENQAVDQEKVEEKIDKVDTPKKEKEELAKSRPQSTQPANSCAVGTDSTGISTTKDSPVVQWQCKQCGQVVQSQQEGTDHMGSVHLHCQATKLKSVRVNSSQVVPVTGDIHAKGVSIKNRCQPFHDNEELIAPIDIAEAIHDVPTTVDEDFISMSGFDDIEDPSTYFIPNIGKKDRQWEPHSEDEVRQEASKLHLFEDSISSKSGSGSPKSQNELDENNSEISGSVDIENSDTECGSGSSEEFKIGFSRDVCSKDVTQGVCERPKRQIKVKRCEDFDYDIDYIPKGRSDSRVSQTGVTKTYIGKGKSLESVTSPRTPEMDSVNSTPRDDDEEYEIVFFKNKYLESSPICDGVVQESKNCQSPEKSGHSSKALVLQEKMTTKLFSSESGALLKSLQNDDCSMKDKVSVQAQHFEQEIERKGNSSRRSEFEGHRRKGPVKDVNCKNASFKPSCNSKDSNTSSNHMKKEEEHSNGNKISVEGTEAQIKEEKDPDTDSSCYTQKSSGQIPRNESSIDSKAVATVKIENDETSIDSGEVHRQSNAEVDLTDTRIKEEIKEFEIHEEVADFDLDSSLGDVNDTSVVQKGRIRREGKEKIPEAMTLGLSYEIEIKNESEEELDVLKEEAFSPVVLSHETIVSKSCEGVFRNKDICQKVDKESSVKKPSKGCKETDDSDSIGPKTSSFVETHSLGERTEVENIECVAPKECLREKDCFVKDRFKKASCDKGNTLEDVCEEVNKEQIFGKSKEREVLKLSEAIPGEKGFMSQNLEKDRKPRESIMKDKHDILFICEELSDYKDKEICTENILQKSTTALENTQDSISEESQVSKNNLKEETIEDRQGEESCSNTKPFHELSPQNWYLHKACNKKIEKSKTAEEMSVKRLGITDEKNKSFILKDHMLRKGMIPKDRIKKSLALKDTVVERDKAQIMFSKNRIDETSAIDRVTKKCSEKYRIHQKCFIQDKTKMKFTSSRTEGDRGMVHIMEIEDLKVDSVQEGTLSQDRDSQKTHGVPHQVKNRKEMEHSAGHMKLDRHSIVSGFSSAIESHRGCTKRVLQKPSSDIDDSYDKAVHKDPPSKKLRIGLINKTFEFSPMNHGERRTSNEGNEVSGNGEDSNTMVVHEECNLETKTISLREGNIIEPTISYPVSDEDPDSCDISVMPAKSNELDIGPSDLSMDRIDGKRTNDTSRKSETSVIFSKHQSNANERMSKASSGETRVYDKLIMHEDSGACAFSKNLSTVVTSTHVSDPSIAIASCSTSSGRISGLREVDSKDHENIPSKVSVPCVTVIKTRKEYLTDRGKAQNTGPSHLMAAFASSVPKDGLNENVSEVNLDSKVETIRCLKETKGSLECGTSKVTKLSGSENPSLGSSNTLPIKNKIISFTGGITPHNVDDHSVRATEPESYSPTKECPSPCFITPANSQKLSGHVQNNNSSEQHGKSRGAPRYVEIHINKAVELDLPRVKAAIQSSSGDASPPVSNIETCLAQVKSGVQDSGSTMTVFKKVQQPVFTGSLPGTSEIKTDLCFSSQISVQEECKAEVEVSAEKGIEKVQGETQEKDKDGGETYMTDKISGKNETLRHYVGMDGNAPTKEPSYNAKASAVLGYKPVLPASASGLGMSTTSVETQVTTAVSHISKNKAMSFNTSTLNQYLEKNVAISSESKHLESNFHPGPEFEGNDSVKEECSPSKELGQPIVLKVQTKPDDVLLSEKSKVKSGVESQVLIKSGQLSCQTSIAEDATDPPTLGDHTCGKAKVALVPQMSSDTKPVVRMGNSAKGKTQISLQNDCTSMEEATASVLEKNRDCETQLDEVPPKSVSTKQTVCNQLLHESESFNNKDFQKNVQGRPAFKDVSQSESYQKEDSQNESEGNCNDKSSEMGEVRFGMFARAKTLQLDVGMLKKTRDKMVEMTEKSAGKLTTKDLWAFIKTVKPESSLSNQSVKETGTGSCISPSEVSLKSKDRNKSELVLQRTTSFAVSGKHDYTRNPSRTPSPDTFCKESPSKKLKCDVSQPCEVNKCDDTEDTTSSDTDSLAVQDVGNVTHFRSVSSTPEDPILKLHSAIDTLYDLEGEAVHHQDATFGDLSYSHDLL